MIYLQLFFEFFKVSCFTFGGAYGAIPLIRDIVISNGWITDERLSYMIAVSESTPGPITINLATYVGSDQAGFWGALIATMGVLVPAYFMILLIVTIMQNVIRNKYVQALLQGLKPCVAGIILATGVYMVIRNTFPLTAETVMDIRAILITAVLLVSMLLKKKFTQKSLSPISLICIAAVLGMIIYGI